MHIGLILRPALTLAMLDPPEFDRIVVDGKVYHEGDDYNVEVFFYDLLDGPDGELCAIEFHIDKSHPMWNVLQGKVYVTQELFPCLWLRGVSKTTARGLEAFGYIRLFKAECGEVCLAIETEHWFTEADKRLLKKQLASSPPERDPIVPEK